MSKRKMVPILVVASLLASAALVSAQPRFLGRGMRHMDALASLELTETQKDQVKDLFSDLEKKRIGLRADLQLKKLELREAMDADKVNEGNVKKLVKEMGSLKTELHMTRIDQQLGLKKILTPKQLEQLRQHRAGGMMGGKMGAMRKMKRGPGGQ